MEGDMDGDGLTRFRHLTWTEAKRIDEICDRFEARWKAGDRPAIEDFLDEAGGPRRTALLRELLDVEMSYRQERQEIPRVEEYLAIFPGDEPAIREVFERAPTADVADDVHGGGEPAKGAADAPEAPDPEAPFPFSDFELGAKLGETGMSTVYAAVQRSLGKRVAVKVLRLTRTASACAVRRFLQEARAVARLRHEDIVDVHGVGRTDDGSYFLVMDLVDGLDLEKRIDPRKGGTGPLPFRQAAEIVATVAGAVEHAHKNGIIHRDLKPSNVLLEKGSRPLLTDFGLAKHLEVEISRLSGPNDMVGTPCYMAPEQADSLWGAVSPRTDVYGLGAVLYALVTGKPPFEGPTLDAIIARVKSPHPPISPRACNPEVPEALQEICMRCLRKDPSERHAGAAEVARALGEWLASSEPVREDGGLAGGLEEIARRLREADEPEAFDLIRRLEQSGRSVAIRPLLRCLSHGSPAVRKRAGKALLRIGWDRMALVIERAARDALEEDLGAALQALSAFEAHADSVDLLERLVPLLAGQLRHQAILVLERKQLALTTDRITTLFREIESRYRIERALGQGPFTACFQARDERFGIPVVVRLLRPEFASRPDLAASFLDLGRQSYAHVHHNLLSVRDIGSDPERHLYYVVRDYVEGITLQQLLQSGKSFTPEQVVDLLRRLCEALEPIHSSGLVHGGVKPSNVFVRGDGRPLLGDRTLPLHKSNVPLERRSYDFAYASPEAARGDAVVGPTSDLYSVGCIAYELLAGRPPFLSANPMELVIMHARDPVPPVSSPRVDLGNGGERFVRRLLEKRPEDRFPDVSAAIQELPTVETSFREMRWASIGASEPLATSSTIEQLEPSQLSLSLSASALDITGAVQDESLTMPLDVGRHGGLSRRGYRVVRKIGRGGMGVVYEAIQVSLNRKVILKVVAHDYSPRAVAMRAHREAQVMARLAHPRIVPIYDLFENGGTLVIAMKLMEGGSLGSRLQRRGSRLPLCEALKLTGHAAEALSHAHAQGVLHRDVKPSNILLDAEGQGYLADFGLAGSLSRAAVSATQITQAGQILGTPVYMAPESFESGRPMPTMDVYSLGVTAYQMLSGKLPYEAESYPQLVLKVARGKALPLSKRASVPEDIAAFVEKMMHAEPGERPTATEAASELRSLRAKHCPKDAPEA
jgi:serine/threonine-protein kinase